MKVVFKNWAPFIDCISETNNTQVDNAKDLDVVISMYNLIELSDKDSKISGSLWKYCRDGPALIDSDITECNANNATIDLLKLKEKIVVKTGNNGIKGV